MESFINVEQNSLDSLIEATFKVQQEDERELGPVLQELAGLEDAFSFHELLGIRKEYIL